MEDKKMKNNYNGWKNRQTWNIALWLQNDENLYNSAKSFVEKCINKRNLYTRFILGYDMINQRTPDNISYSGTRIDYKALNELMIELYWS
jgi:hypothetical protein